MGGNLTLDQIKAALAQSQGAPKPWDTPMTPTPSPVPTPAATPIPATPPPPPTNPANDQALMQAQKLMQQRQQLAPLGTEEGMVGLEGQGISAQDATLIQKLLKMLGM